MKQQTLISHSSGSGVGQESISWLLNSCLLTVFLCGKEREGEMDYLSCVASSKATSPFHEDSTLMILLPPEGPTSKCHIEELGLQYMNFRGTNNTFRWGKHKGLIVKLFFSLSVMSDSDIMDCSTPGFPVLHHLLELAQTHVHWVNDAIQPSSSVPPRMWRKTEKVKLKGSDHECLVG